MKILKIKNQFFYIKCPKPNFVKFKILKNIIKFYNKDMIFPCQLDIKKLNKNKFLLNIKLNQKLYINQIKLQFKYQIKYLQNNLIFIFYNQLQNNK